MSRSPNAPIPVIEWSPTHVTAFDPTTKQLHEAASIADLAGLLSHHKELIIAISRRSSFVRTARVPNAGKDEVVNIIRLQLANLFPVPSSELAMDFQLTSDVNTEGRLAVIAAVRSDLLRQLHQELRATGFHAAMVTTATFGSWLLAQSLQEPDCAIVEHTHEGLGVDVIFGSDLRYTRVAPFPTDKNELEAEICRTFNIAKVPCSTTIAVGGLAFEGATRLYPGRTLEAFTFPIADKLDVRLELPEKVAERATKKLRQKMQTALLLCAVTLAAAFFVFNERVQKANEVADRQAMFANELSQVNKSKAVRTSSLAELTTLSETVERGFKPSQSLRDAIIAVTNAAPPGVWLTGISAERGKPLQIRGTSTTSEGVSNYLAFLSTEQRLSAVNLAFQTNSKIEDVPVFQFSISAHVVGNFPLEALKDAKKK